MAMRYGPVRDAYARKRIREENRKKQQQTGPCERCGLHDQLMSFTYTDDYGDIRVMMICWDCNFEIINGRGGPDDNQCDVLENRMEENEGLDL